jgi:hypothetical protein
VARNDLCLAKKTTLQKGAKTRRKAQIKISALQCFDYLHAQCGLLLSIYLQHVKRKGREAEKYVLFGQARQDTDSGMAPSFGSFNSGCGRSCHFAMSKLSKQILPHPTEVNGNAWQRVTPIFTPQEDRPVHRNPGTAETFSESLDEIRGRFQTRGCRGCGDLLYSLFSAWPSLHPKKKTVSINFKQTCPCCFKNL